MLFFSYKKNGGVEGHLYLLSLMLTQRGHKVYYVPIWLSIQKQHYQQFIDSFQFFEILFSVKEINIVHGHQAFSSLCHEVILHARTMGMRVCFTDHSLFGFVDASSILMNKVLKFTFSDIDLVICVSNTSFVNNYFSNAYIHICFNSHCLFTVNWNSYLNSKENTVLRAALTPQMVSVIPNDVVASQFKPGPSAQDKNFSSGMDLLVAAIPRICKAEPK
ncbi:7054_t:CDS:2, partial [Gigaspora rosea]